MALDAGPSNVFKLAHLPKRVKDHLRLIAAGGADSSGNQLFSDLDFTGADITSITNRAHNDLQSISGGDTGEYYHLTQEQHAGLTAVKTIDDGNSPYTVLDTDGVIVCDTQNGSITVNIPAVSATSRLLCFKKIHANNTVTIDGNGSEKIDGATTYSLTANDEFVQIINDATEWFVIGAT